jgi:hypothetical protein
MQLDEERAFVDVLYVEAVELNVRRRKLSVSPGLVLLAFA